MADHTGKGTVAGTIDEVKGLTPEQMAENDKLDINSLIWGLALEGEPFFSDIFSRIGRIRSRDLPTAGVGVREKEVNMWWNPDFFAKLTKKEKFGVLKHEAYHLALFHCTHRRLKPHKIANWAADCAINWALGEDELPGSCFVPGRDWGELPPDRAAKMSPTEIRIYEGIRNLLKSLPPAKKMEWYFTAFMENDSVQEMLKLEESLSKAFKEMMEGGDDHDFWDDIPEEDRPYIEGVLREAVKEATNKAAASNSWGSVPHEMRETIQASFRNEISWQTVLRKFIGVTRRAESRSSWKRRSRKMPGKAPGKARNYLANIAIYVDQSGSVGNEDLKVLMSELNSLARNTTFTVFPFDTQVDEKNKYEWKKGKTIAKFNRTRSGGTCFNCVTKHVHENKGEFDGYLIMTDGESSKPPVSKLRRGWVIVPDRELLFSPDARDFVIKLTGEA
jgi:predicted metal-dependent peptidase